MDAPKGRYRVVEKDGRLVVIDNETGAPIPSTVVPPEIRRGRDSGAPPRSSATISPAGPGPIDRAADMLLSLAVKEWDSQGRAVIAWQWEYNNAPRRWDARLDSHQQRRLGRALLALAAAPLYVLLLILSGGALIVLGLLFLLPPFLWGMLALRRLYRETNFGAGAG